MTACVTWAFFRMIWGWLLLCVVCTSCNCGPIQLAYTVVRVVYGGVLTFLGLKLATQAHSGNMPGHLEMMVVIGVLIFQVSLTPEAAGLWEPEAAGGPTTWRRRRRRTGSTLRRKTALYLVPTPERVFQSH